MCRFTILHLLVIAVNVITNLNAVRAKPTYSFYKQICSSWYFFKNNILTKSVMVPDNYQTVFNMTYTHSVECIKARENTYIIILYLHIKNILRKALEKMFI